MAEWMSVTCSLLNHLVLGFQCFHYEQNLAHRCDQVVAFYICFSADFCLFVVCGIFFRTVKLRQQMIYLLELHFTSFYYYDCFLLQPYFFLSKCLVPLPDYFLLWYCLMNGPGIDLLEESYSFIYFLHSDFRWVWHLTGVHAVALPFAHCVYFAPV